MLGEHLHAQHRHPVGIDGVIGSEQRPQTGTDARRVRQRDTDRFGERPEEGFGFAEEMLAALDERASGLVPQGEHLEGLVRAGLTVRAFERDRDARIGLGFAGSSDRVELVGLALVAVLCLLRGARRTHVAYVMTVADQEHARVSAEPAGALDAPTCDRPEPGRPGLHRTMPFARHPERLRAQHTAAFIEHRRGQPPFMRIHANNVGCLAACSCRSFRHHSLLSTS